MSRRKRKQIKREILAALSDGEMKSITEISSITGVSRATVRKYLGVMIGNLEVELKYNSTWCKLYQLKRKPKFVICKRCKGKVVIPE